MCDEHSQWRKNVTFRRYYADVGKIIEASKTLGLYYSPLPNCQGNGWMDQTQVFRKIHACLN